MLVKFSLSIRVLHGTLWSYYHDEESEATFQIIKVAHLLLQS